MGKKKKYKRKKKKGKRKGQKTGQLPGKYHKLTKKVFNKLRRASALQNEGKTTEALEAFDGVIKLYTSIIRMKPKKDLLRKYVKKRDELIARTKILAMKQKKKKKKSKGKKHDVEDFIDYEETDVNMDWEPTYGQKDAQIDWKDYWDDDFLDSSNSEGSSEGEEIDGSGERKIIDNKAMDEFFDSDDDSSSGEDRRSNVGRKRRKKGKKRYSSTSGSEENKSSDSDSDDDFEDQRAILKNKRPRRYSWSDSDSDDDFEDHRVKLKKKHQQSDSSEEDDDSDDDFEVHRKNLKKDKGKKKKKKKSRNEDDDVTKRKLMLLKSTNDELMVKNESAMNRVTELEGENQHLKTQLQVGTHLQQSSSGDVVLTLQKKVEMLQWEVNRLKKENLKVFELESEIEKLQKIVAHLESRNEKLAEMLKNEVTYGNGNKSKDFQKLEGFNKNEVLESSVVCKDSEDDGPIERDVDNLPEEKVKDDRVLDSETPTPTTSQDRIPESLFNHEEIEKRLHNPNDPILKEAVRKKYESIEEFSKTYLHKEGEKETSPILTEFHVGPKKITIDDFPDVEE